MTTHPPIAITLFSFGYKYEAPRETNLLFDVRFLHNPYHVDELRPFTGLDERISDFVLQNKDGEACLQQLRQVITFFADEFGQKGNKELLVAVGCTGGHHRSVAVIEALAKMLMKDFQHVSHRHRDITKESH
ncbi:MAG: RNase adapter RapZ [Thermodesulfobacteriota bacterium]